MRTLGSHQAIAKQSKKSCPRLHSLQVKAEPKDVKAATVQRIFHAVRDFLAYVPADLHSMSEEDVHRDAEYRYKVLLASFSDEPEAMDYFHSQWGDKIGERRFARVSGVCLPLIQTLHRPVLSNHMVVLAFQLLLSCIGFSLVNLT